MTGVSKTKLLNGTKANLKAVSKISQRKINIHIGKRTISVTREQLAYTAGLFDGEGCVTFQKNARRKDGIRHVFYIAVYIVNTDASIMEWLHTTYGGYVHCRKSGTKVGWKPYRNWRLSWGEAADFLAAIKPWTIIKRKQVDVALQWRDARPGTGKMRTPDRIAYDGAISMLVDQLRELNRKGVI